MRRLRTGSGKMSRKEERVDAWGEEGAKALWKALVEDIDGAKAQ